MPDQNEKPAQPAGPETILIAHVTTHLIDGSSFELYPFVNAKDVKAEVSKTVGEWASSGFLLRGSRMIPWHQVKLLETTSVEEITRREAEQRMLRWQAEDQLKQVQGFWKTKEEQGGGESGGQSGEEKQGAEKQGESE